MYSISEGKAGRCLRAATFIARGTRLFVFDPSRWQKEKTYQTIQVGPEQHHLPDSDLVLLNHSCNPNLIVNTEKGLVYALQDIYPGEELTYFYPSTEWDLARPFACRCGSPRCLKYIRGALWTPLNYLLGHFINRHIAELIQKKIAVASTFENFLKEL
ncbi:MAG TPA: SET domain-containing protein [Firmicutes bacterium]|nr:SET domain-containing protein [Bacillota bacterium]